MVKYYNYIRRARRAECLRVTMVNKLKVVEFIKSHNAYSADILREEYIIVRADSYIKTLTVGDWCVIGEDGLLRFYSEEDFHKKYEVIV